jgi:hypothetical protein
MLRELAELYARRAREFSDAVARLGRHNQIGPEISLLLTEISKRRDLCTEAAEKLDQYVEQEARFRECEVANARTAGAA